ncbi:MAG: hypothetical protein ACLS43_07140 [Evtepia gabavorous]
MATPTGSWEEPRLRPHREPLDQGLTLWCSPGQARVYTVRKEACHDCAVGKDLLFAGCTAFVCSGQLVAPATACLGVSPDAGGAGPEPAFPCALCRFDTAEAGTQGPTVLFSTCRRRFAEGGQESWARAGQRL